MICYGNRTRIFPSFGEERVEPSNTYKSSGIEPEPKTLSSCYHYTTTDFIMLEQVAGIEPATFGWKPKALPLHHTCLISVVSISSLSDLRFPKLTAKTSVRFSKHTLKCSVQTRTTEGNNFANFQRARSHFRSFLGGIKDPTRG